MDVGKELAAARQRAGLSRAEIARTTKVRLAKIEALEKNAFERLPSGIYLDGIVRAYTREVGLDPEEFVHHVRAASRRRPAWRLGSWWGRTEEPSSPADEPTQGELNLSGADDAPPPIAPADDKPPPPITAADDAPRRRGGFMELVFPVALIVALLGAFGVGAYLYDRSTRSTSDVSASSEAPAETGDAARTGDAAGAGDAGGIGETAGTGGTADGGDPTERENTEDVGETRGTGATAAAGTLATTSVGTSGGDPAGAAPRPASPTAAAPAGEPAGGGREAPRTTAPPSPASTGDLSGAWTLATQVQSSSLNAFQGLRLGYRVQLQQEGDEISGTGRKIAENGRPIGRGGQTPIVLQGTVDGDRLTLTFTERGTRRQSAGTFHLVRERDNLLRGRFSSDAAQSAGTVEARR